jgi:prevent-host-death family protein
MTTMRSPPSKTVGARELKTRLGAYLRAVAGGATLTVTERGRPVARLMPIPPDEVTADAALDELSALGIVSRANGEPMPLVKAARSSGEPIERTIARGRVDRF